MAQEAFARFLLGLLYLRAGSTTFTVPIAAARVSNTLAVRCADLARPSTCVERGRPAAIAMRPGRMRRPGPDVPVYLMTRVPAVLSPNRMPSGCWVICRIS